MDKNINEIIIMMIIEYNTKSYAFTKRMVSIGSFNFEFFFEKFNAS